jgi:uncharacterized protein (TIGR02145 family)
MGTLYWLDPPGAGSNDYDFTANPAGWYNGATNRYVDLYAFAGWWSTDATETTATCYSIAYYCNRIQKELKEKADGLSVRCVLDY